MPLKPLNAAWETVAAGELDITERMRIPGGYLYRTIVLSDMSLNQAIRRYHRVVALCFVPDGGS